MVVSVDKLDALKAQRTRVSTSDTRDPGWTDPPGAFLELTRPRPEVAPVDGIDAVLCMDQLSYLKGRGDSTRRSQIRPPMPPADITLYRVDGTGPSGGYGEGRRARSTSSRHFLALGIASSISYTGTVAVARSPAALGRGGEARKILL